MSVEPWASFPNPRAYTAAPMAPAVGVFHAAAWLFSHSEELSWASLALVVPHQGLMSEIEQLRRLKSRGVRMGTIAQAERARNFDRALIAYRPEAATLVRAEAMVGVRVLVAVGGGPEEVGAWVSQHRPVHLGGAALTDPTPVPPPPRAVPVVS